MDVWCGTRRAVWSGRIPPGVPASGSRSRPPRWPSSAAAPTRVCCPRPRAAARTAGGHRLPGHVAGGSGLLRRSGRPHRASGTRPPAQRRNNGLRRLRGGYRQCVVGSRRLWAGPARSMPRTLAPPSATPWCFWPARPLPPLAAVPLRVALHDPCHARHGQGILAEPRALSGRDPGFASRRAGGGGGLLRQRRYLGSAPSASCRLKLGRRKAAQSARHRRRPGCHDQSRLSGSDCRRPGRWPRSGDAVRAYLAADRPDLVRGERSTQENPVDRQSRLMVYNKIRIKEYLELPDPLGGEDPVSGREGGTRGPNRRSCRPVPVRQRRVAPAAVAPVCAGRN